MFSPASQIHVFPTPEAMAAHVAEAFLHLAQQSAIEQQPCFVALSGGSTPERLYRELARRAAVKKPDWGWLHLFWGDERCVPPDNPESNFGVADRLFLKPTDFPRENIHRIRGEADPMAETVRYEKEIRRFVTIAGNGMPRFDWILLGMGADGHTASLFPNSDTLQIIDKICAGATHPQSGQQRITLTLPVINHARRITFLVTGANKSEMVYRILTENSISEKYPASLVQPVDGELHWYLDDAAASLLKNVEY
ncbi:MAG: 6-phosphogluconolactonase [Calditrichia bacterium]